jgi:hypothetical protein
MRSFYTAITLSILAGWSLLLVSCGGGKGDEGTQNVTAAVATPPTATLPAAVSVATSGSAAIGGVSGMADAAGTEAGSATSGAAATSGTTSTAGSAGAAGGVPATFGTVKLVLGGGGGIMPCFAAPCHGVNGHAPPARPLELPVTDDQRLYTTLMTYVSKACADKKLIAAGDPEQSALVTILKGPCGATPRMPYGCSAQAGDCIPDEYIDAVARWIASGAAPTP